jgi:hypothetical protein
MSTGLRWIPLGSGPRAMKFVLQIPANAGVRDGGARPGDRVPPRILERAGRRRPMIKLGEAYGSGNRSYRGGGRADHSERTQGAQGVTSAGWSFGSAGLRPTAGRA